MLDQVISINHLQPWAHARSGLELLHFRCEGRLLDANWFKGEWSTLRIYVILEHEWRRHADAI